MGLCQFQDGRCLLLWSGRAASPPMVRPSPSLSFCSSSPDRLMERSNSTGPAVRYRFPASNEAGDQVDCSGVSCRSCTAVLLADCIALGCCPCAVVSVLALALVKVPWVVSRRCLESLRRRGVSLRRRVAHAGDADVRRAGKSSEIIARRSKPRESVAGTRSVRGSLPSRAEADDRVWMELYQVGNWGFGRVSFSAAQREWRFGKNTGACGGHATAPGASGEEERGKQ